MAPKGDDCEPNTLGASGSTSWLESKHAHKGCLSEPPLYLCKTTAECRRWCSERAGLIRRRAEGVGAGLGSAEPYGTVFKGLFAAWSLS